MQLSDTIVNFIHFYNSSISIRQLTNQDKMFLDLKEKVFRTDAAQGAWTTDCIKALRKHILFETKELIAKQGSSHELMALVAHLCPERRIFLTILTLLVMKTLVHSSGTHKQAVDYLVTILHDINDGKHDMTWFINDVITIHESASCMRAVNSGIVTDVIGQLIVLWKRPLRDSIQSSSDLSSLTEPTLIQTTENTIMPILNFSKTAIEYRPFIFGAPADEVPKGDIYDAIKQIQTKISDLVGLKIASKAVNEEVEALNKQLNELVLYLDEKYAASEPSTESKKKK